MKSRVQRAALVVVAAIALGGCKAETPNAADANVSDASSTTDASMTDASASDASTGPTDATLDTMPDVPEGPPVQALESVLVEAQHRGGDGLDCVEATCPDGKVLVGGGGAWDPGISITSMGPSGGETWAICGTAAAPGAWSAEASCAIVTRTITAVEATVSTVPPDVCPADPDGNVPSACPCNCFTAACPAGTVPLLGGGTWSDDFSFDGSDRRGPDLWGICGCASEEPGANTSLDVSIRCIEDAVPRSRFVTLTHPDTGRACVTSPCEANELLIGGGGSWSFGVDVDQFAIRDDAWSICGETNTEWTWTASAICIAE